MKSGESLRIEKKFKDLESASAKRRSRGRKRSSSYTLDPTTPPKDSEMSTGRMSAAVTDSAFGNANDDAAERDWMLVAAGEDNYVKPTHEATPTAAARRMTYLCTYVLHCLFVHLFILMALRDVVNTVILL